MAANVAADFAASALDPRLPEVVLVTNAHVIGPTAILGSKDGAWNAETSYIVVRTMHDGEMQLFSAGRYVDEIVVEGGAARFRKRIVVPDSSRFDTLLSIPL